MENHRLKPMKENYNESLFNKIYKETTSLRKSLVYSIDHRRFGVTSDIVYSWFDDKFILVFNKYCEQYEEDVLKGHIINSLKTFKSRILRKAYNGEGEFYQSLVSKDGEYDLMNTLDNLIEDNQVSYVEEKTKLYDYLYSTLSDNAYLVAQVLLSPPPFILSRLQGNNSRISNELLLDYFELEHTYDNEDWIKKLKKEFNKAIKNAKEKGL